jgi:hypothetical protein
MSDISPNSFVNALVATKSASLEAVGNLHALFYHWHKLDRHERTIALNSAKHELERALVAVVLAEKEITSPAKSEPYNVVQIGDHDKEYRNTVDTVASIVGAPQFDGAA